MNHYKKPKRVDYNLVVIGAGSAGLVSAYIAAAVNAKVALVEKYKMGGDCLNTGCVPSKALLRSAKLLAQARRPGDYGFNSINIDFEFQGIMERVQRVIRTIEPHDSVARYTGLGVECFHGEAKIITPFSVKVDERILTTRNIIIAAGASPFIPPIPGLNDIRFLTSDSIWNLRKLPRRLVVLGGGPIGCELSQCFARFGSEVTQIEMLPEILPREDPDISSLILEKFKQEKIRVLANHRVIEVKKTGEEKIIVCESRERKIEITCDELLVAVGRKANTENFGLADLDVSLSDDGTVAVNRFMQTNYPNIYACGDAAGPYQFTHTASHQAWYASVNALFGSAWKFKVDYSSIPWATFTDPEVARVGLNEQEARHRNIPYEVTTFPMEDLDRAIIDEETRGMVKVLTVPGKDRILGATIVADHAGELITEYISAMRNNFGLNRILGTIHIYPTLAEANKYAAGIWKKNHAPAFLLDLAKKFHRWQRGN